MDESSLNIHPARLDAVDPPVDRMGRKQLHPVNFTTWVEAAVLCGVPLSPIPGSYWSLDVDAEGYSVAVVACPCGNTPSVPAAGLAMCREDEGEQETCPRGYVFTGEGVFVLASPKEPRPSDLQTPGAS